MPWPRSGPGSAPTPLWSSAEMRPFVNKSLGWLFGLALSILFISLWGRAVVIDSDGLSDAMGPLAGSTVVTDRLADWLEEELIDSGADREVAGAAVETALRASAMDEVLDSLVDAVVLAAASPAAEGSTVDVGAIIAPAVPEITASLEAAGTTLSEDEIAGILDSLEPLVITEPGTRPVIGRNSELASRLGLATVLAILVMTASGSLLVMTSSDRPGELRLLLEKAALGGLSFAVLLRLGSWVLDPGGGRAPVSRAFSMLLGNHWTVPLAVGVGAALGASLLWLFRRRRRNVAGRKPKESDQNDLNVAA